MSEVQKYKPNLYIGVIASKYFNYLPTSKHKHCIVGNWMVIPYLVLLCWLLPRMGFVKKAGLGTRLTIGLFLIKATAGFVLGWLSLRYTNSDYWQLNGLGWDEYQLLLHNPREYFTNLFGSGYAHGYGGVLESTNSYWNDLKTNLVIKFISVCNIFSQGNYYINSLFFNLIGFLGHLAFYRVFIQLYPARKWAVIIGCFLLPSMLCFSSGVHKDGIMFTCMGLVCLAMYQWHVTRKLTLKGGIVLGLSLALIFLLRNLVFLAVVPALGAYLLIIFTRWKPLYVFAGVYLIGVLLFFGSSYIAPSINLPAQIAQKQGFYLLVTDATTQIPMDTLQPTALGFLRNAPQAINHVALRPYITERSSLFLVPIAWEFLIYQLLFVLFWIFRRRGQHSDTNQAFLLFALLFGAVNMLSIGYIVNNLGSIVRYRSLFLPLLITPILAGMDWEKIGRLFKLGK